MSLLVMGSVAFDDVRTPVGFREKVLGGSAMYFAWAAATLTRTHLVAAVGRDFPDDYHQMLVDRGIGMDGLHRIETADTFYWKGSYGEDLNEAHTDAVHLNVLESWKPIVPDHHKKTPFVFLANDAPANQLHFLDQMEDTQLSLCDTRDLWIDQDKEGLMEVMRRTDGIVLNDGEAKMLSGERNIVKAGRRLHDLGSRIVIIKRGEYGAFLTVGGRGFAMPAYPVAEVVDPTGAGDSFAGGLMGYLSLIQSSSLVSLKQAMLAATVTASFCVEGFSLDCMQELDRTRFDVRLEELRTFLSL